MLQSAGEFVTRTPARSVPAGHVSNCAVSSSHTIWRLDPAATRCPSKSVPAGQTSGQFSCLSTTIPESGQVNFLGSLGG
jgi:hypothetical protein